MKRTLRLFIFGFLLLATCAEMVLAGPLPKKSRYSKHKKNRKPALYSNGGIYDIASKKRTTIYYTRSYSKAGKNIYRTTYNIFDREKKIISKITATHNKSRHSLEVSVKDLVEAGFPILNIERTEYDKPFPGRFGSTGKVGAIGKAKALGTTPSQLTLKFSNPRYDYVKVIYIADSHEDSGKDLKVFILEE